jgi:hypothetical protein
MGGMAKQRANETIIRTVYGSFRKAGFGESRGLRPSTVRWNSQVGLENLFLFVCFEICFEFEFNFFASSPLDQRKKTEQQPTNMARDGTC